MTDATALLSKSEADDFLAEEANAYERAAKVTGRYKMPSSLATRIRLLLQHRKILVLGPLALFVFALLWSKSGWTGGSYCVYDDIEFKMSTLWYAKDLLDSFFDSYKMNMPCFPRLHMSVPNGEVDQFKQYVIDKDLPNVFVWPENLPFPRNDWAWGGKGSSQWTEWIADEHIKAPWVLYLDSDIMFTMPFNCPMSFDDEGKPIVRLWPWWYQWPKNHEAIRLAREKRPDKWRWTEEEELKIRGDSYMSYFPIIIPTEILAKTREIFEDAYEQPIHETLIHSVDYSQFDMFRRVTRLLYPDKLRWTSVDLSEFAFAPNASHAATEASYDVDPLIHTPFHHAYDLNHVPAPGIQDGDDQYWRRAKILAKHSLCMRLAHWPHLNRFDPHTLHRDILPHDSDRECNATDILVPETAMTHMYDRTRFYQDWRVPVGKTRWIQETFGDHRRLCTHRAKRKDGKTWTQGWWQPSDVDISQV